MTTTISMHQPNYLPWLGYFHKMTYSDIFVFLDEVQYSPKTYTNRALILQNGRPTRLSVPVTVEPWNAPITRVGVDTAAFARKHLETIRYAYGKCAYYREILDLLLPAYDLGATNLVRFNITLIEAIARFLGLTPRFVRLSELGLQSKSNQLLIDIAKRCEADTFVSGTGAKKYIEGNENSYAESSITLAYQNFVHPSYRQRTAPFVDGCSIIDLLLNTGGKALQILTSQPEPPY